MPHSQGPHFSIKLLDDGCPHMLNTWFRFPSALFAFWGLVLAVLPGDMESLAPPVLPGQVMLGTEVGIFGSGFDGGKVPAVFAVTEGVKKRLVIAVESYSDTLIMGTVKKIPSTKKDPAGGKEWTVMVQPRGSRAGAEVEVGTVSTVAPEVLSVSPGAGAPGDLIDVRVRNAGPGKLRVSVNGKKAKVTTSFIDEDDLDKGDDEEPLTLRVRIPKVPDGFYDVVVSNKLGSTPTTDQVEVAGSPVPLPKDGLSAVISGKKLRAKGEQLSSLLGEVGEVTLDVQKGKSVIRQLVVTMPLDIEVDEPPLRYTSAPASIGYGEIHPDGSSPGWSSNTGTLDIVVNSKIDGRFQVTFSGTLIEEGALGEATERDVKGTAVFTNTLFD